jgi:alpha-L-rhamnosidase
VDVPTDCPQRDERLGWTGDAQAFSSTAAFNMDVSGFFAKWLMDLAADQQADGLMPFVIPDVLSRPKNGAAGWGDAATVIPWNLYLAYGDRGILGAQYPSMVKWVEYERSRAKNSFLWSGDEHFGDWLDFFGAGKDTRYGATSTDLIATAYYAHSAQIVSQTAQVLGRAQDANEYQQLFSHIRDAFLQAYVQSDGTVGAGTQTAYVLALDFDL